MPTDGEPHTPSIADIERQLERLAAKGELIREVDAHGESTFSAAKPAPLPALLVLTFLCSLGTGSLWTGLPFVAEHDFNFTKVENLWLAIADATVYVVVAYFSGPLLRAVQRRLSPRGVLVALMAVQTLICPLPLMGSVWGVIATALGTSAVAATLWPVVESYLSSGRHGHRLRHSVGLFNIVWTSAVAAGLFMMAPLFATQYTRLAIVAIGPCCLLSALCLPWFPSKPPPHLDDGQAPIVPPVYRPLRDATRSLLPTSYLLIGALGPLLPYAIAKLSVAAAWQTPLAATWLSVRVFAMLGMWRLRFWHGKWTTLALGAALMSGGFFVAMVAGTVPTLIAALAAFGVGHSILYYASLYYAMSVGHGEVDAGGHFEALIGAGYIMGPLASLAGVWIGGEMSVQWCVLGVAALASMLAAREWLRWRRNRHTMAPSAAVKH